MPPSRQERRKAERDAAKRAPATAGAAGNAGTAAALVNPLGDWTTQSEDPNALVRAFGAKTLKQKADAGDREAQFSLGYWLMCEGGGGEGTLLGASGRSPKADVGSVLCTETFPVAHNTKMRRCGVTFCEQMII